MTTRDGVRLAVRRWTPAEPVATTAVVLVHGFGATKDDPSVVAVADSLARQGHLVVSYTGRGHGESEGLCTLGDLEHLDVEAAVAEARPHAQRVLVVGTSMGAIAALRHASGAALDGVITVSSPAEWSVPRTLKSAGAALLTQLAVGRWAARRFLGVRLARGWSGGASPAALVATLSAPLVVIHGTGDRFIRHTEANKLHDASRGRSRLILVDGMGHAYMPESIPVIGDAVRWILDGEPVGTPPPPRRSR